MVGVGKRLMALARPLMVDVGSGCGAELAKRLDREGPVWCRDNRAYILEEMFCRARAAGVPWDREAAGELLELVIKQAELEA